MDVRAGAAREASELKIALGNGFKEQGALSQAAAGDVVAKVDAAVKSITGALASARQAGSTEMVALDVAHQTRQDAATAEMRALVEALRREMAAKIESGFLKAIERQESGNQRAVDDVAGLRASAETKLTSLQTELGTALARLSARHEDHGSELVKTGQTAGRVFRLAVANLILVLVALAVSGFALVGSGNSGGLGSENFGGLTPRLWRRAGRGARSERHLAEPRVLTGQNGESPGGVTTEALCLPPTHSLSRRKKWLK